MRAVLPFAVALGLLAGPPPAIERATLAEPKAVTPEVSTEELVAILADGSVPVLDVRSPREYAIADARPAGAPAVGALPGAVQIRKGEAEVANEDGRLPHRDKGTRVIVFGADAAEARAVAEEIAHKAYWNSSYFGGSGEAFRRLRSARAGSP